MRSAPTIQGKDSNSTQYEGLSKSVARNMPFLPLMQVLIGVVRYWENAESLAFKHDCRSESPGSMSVDVPFSK